MRGGVNDARRGQQGLRRGDDSYRQRPPSRGTIRVAVPPPIAHRFQEIVDRFFFGPKVSKQFDRIIRELRALLRDEFFDGWVTFA
jgi:hypothetical protein